MELIENQKEGVIIVEPRGRIDSVGSKTFGDRLAELIRSGSHHMLIDFQQILYISSAGFRCLLIARKLVDEVNGKLVLCGMSSEVKRLFDIGAFTDLFTICASRDEGVLKAK
jgi:anti-sigma B factor antagonist